MCGCDYNGQTGHCNNRYPDCPALVDAGSNFGKFTIPPHRFSISHAQLTDDDDDDEDKEEEEELTFLPSTLLCLCIPQVLGSTTTTITISAITSTQLQ